MKFLFVLLAIFFPIFATPFAQAAIGHGGHGAGGGAHSAPPVVTYIEEQAAIVAASKFVKTLVTQKIRVAGAPLASSWLDTSEEKKSIHKKTKGYYVVAFVAENKKQTLYILLSDTGQFYDANFTGKFTILKD